MPPFALGEGVRKNTREHFIMVLLYDTVVQEKVVHVCDWPTDSVSVSAYVPRSHLQGKEDFCTDVGKTEIQPKYLIYFIPGNPGCIGWYTKLLVEIISKLGPEYVAHGISYAGHGVGRSKVVGESAPNKARVTRSFPWTIQGQVDHKIEYICKLLERYRRSRNCQIEIIFVAHSIGSHMVQRICLLRPDLLSITKSVVHLMPFIRFAPSLRSQRLPISVIAHMPKKFSVHILKKLSNLGRKFSFQQTFNLLSDEVKCPEGRVLAASLVRDPEMACNFLSLGVEEIRDLPEARFDVEAMKVINQKSPIYILLCGGPDQWAPHEIFQEFHNNQRKAVPGSSAHLFVNIKYLEELIHGFIVEPTMIPPVVEFIVKSINGAETPSMQAKYFGRSRL